MHPLETRRLASVCTSVGSRSRYEDQIQGFENRRKKYIKSSRDKEQVENVECNVK